MNAQLPCPCGSGETLQSCCGRLHAGAAAPTAEALMRSRYSAYAQALQSYLLDTWHPSTRPSSLDFDPKLKWLGLEVKRHQLLGPDDALVEFVARCKLNGRAGRVHELSRFVREEGRWFYVAAEETRE
ncbi:MAG TPA: YchJ family metal-binding protein [Burkholderiales bacterium]|nr:YchJ family metal-binding protein [Burkholderiales bacterium]